MQVHYTASAYQWQDTRPISDFLPRPIGDQNRELGIWRRVHIYRPISDRLKWLGTVHQKTPGRPISDESSAYQMPNPRPIGDQPIGPSVTTGLKFPKQNTYFTQLSHAVTRARDLNRELTLLTQQPTQTPGSKGGSAPLAPQTHPNPPYPRKESPSGITKSQIPRRRPAVGGKMQQDA
jgi:hypothetical protein